MKLNKPTQQTFNKPQPTTQAQKHIEPFNPMRMGMCFNQACEFMRMDGNKDYSDLSDVELTQIQRLTVKLYKVAVDTEEVIKQLEE